VSVCRALFFMLVGLLPAALAAQERPRFRSGVEAVQIDVRVSRNGRAVTGLTADNFELRDTGVPQKVQATTIEDVPLHLLLVLDTSGSVGNAGLAELKEAAGSAARELSAEDRVTLLTFSRRVRLLADATGNRRDVASELNRAPERDETSLHDALFCALMLRREKPQRGLVIVFSDGLDNTSWLHADTLVGDVRRTDVVVYAVMLVPWWQKVGMTRTRVADTENRLRRWFAQEPGVFPEAGLGAVTDASGGAVYYADGITDLHSVFANIVKQFKSRYLLTYYPENVPSRGWHPIQVRLKGARGDVVARRGYER
jgi:Ca-activated chloride channel family protein